MNERKEDALFNDSWIGIDEAAKYLGVKVVTIREWLKKDLEMPAHRIGKLWKFKKSELDTWVKSGKSAQRSDY
jgi:excisionase family DNA binding protein